MPLVLDRQSACSHRGTREKKGEKKKGMRKKRREMDDVDGGAEAGADVETEGVRPDGDADGFVEKQGVSTDDPPAAHPPDPDLAAVGRGTERGEAAMNPKAPECGGGNAVEADPDDILADRLEKFLEQGVLEEFNSDCSSSPCNCACQRCKEHSRSRPTWSSHYMTEVIKKYPKFFALMPQNPHFGGLLRKDVDASIRQTVLTLLWYRFVELMRTAVRTKFHTRSREIQRLTREARCMEKLGFDVSHLVARLRQPEKRLRRLELSRMAFEDAWERAEEGERQFRLGDISRTHLSDLWKAAKDAEFNALEREWKVDILGRCLNME